MELGIASVAAITAIAYLVGMAVKTTAHYWLNTAAVGIASGWAATGVHQSVKQLTKQEQLRQYAGGVCAHRRVAACADVCYDRAIEWIW